MTKLLQPSMSGGELAPGLHGRVDLARYVVSLAQCRNFIVLPSGGVQKRPGKIFRTEVKTSALATRILPFIYSTTTKYLIEAGNLYFRFLENGAYVESSPGVPLEVVTPYATADLANLRWTQSADVLYLFHGDHRPKELRRLTAASFELVNHNFRHGPFRSLNASEAVLIASTSAIGSTTLTCNTALFEAGMVDSLVLLEEKELRGTKPWEPLERNVTVGTLRRSDGKVYKAVSVPSTGGLGGTPYYICGNTRPTHEVGRAFDGPGDTRNDGVNGYKVGVEWEYVHSGYGIVLITGYTNSTTVTGIVVLRVPDSCIGTAPSPGNTWTLSGDGTTKVFATAGATSTSQADYTVTIDAAPVSPNPYHDPVTGGGGSGGGGGGGPIGGGRLYPV